jgi:hypothetical protein
VTLRRSLWLLPLALAGVLASAQEASAFCRSTTCKGQGCARDDHGCPADGLPLFWPSSCVGFSFQRDLTAKLPPDEVRAAVRKALQAWTQVPCPGGGVTTLTFAENDDTACASSSFDTRGPNVNVILFRDDDYPYRDEDNTLAKTTVTYDPGTGAILDADIEVNTAFNEVTANDKRVVYDLQSIMTHEIGHFIGIAHSDEEQATMFPSYATKSTELRSLDADDVAAACAIYPPDRKASCNPAPSGGEQVCDQAAAPADGGGSGCAIGAGGLPASTLRPRGQGRSPGLSGLSCLVSLAAIAGLVRRRARAEGWRTS